MSTQGTVVTTATPLTTETAVLCAESRKGVLCGASGLYRDHIGPDAGEKVPRRVPLSGQFTTAFKPTARINGDNGSVVGRLGSANRDAKLVSPGVVLVAACCRLCSICAVSIERTAVEARCSIDAIHSVRDAVPDAPADNASCVEMSGGGLSAVINGGREAVLLRLPLALEPTVVSGLHSSVTEVASATHKSCCPLSGVDLIGAVGVDATLATRLVGEKAWWDASSTLRTLRREAPYSSVPAFCATV
jgi:hypothetical protein